jgi:hypothetical protein
MGRSVTSSSQRFAVALQFQQRRADAARGTLTESRHLLCRLDGIARSSRMRVSLALLSTIAGVATLVAIADPLPPDASYDVGRAEGSAGRRAREAARGKHVGLAVASLVK